MVKIYLVRHAQTYFNAFIDCINLLGLPYDNLESYLSHPSDELKELFASITGCEFTSSNLKNKLTINGIRQARTFGLHLKDLESSEPYFVSSHALRAIKTMFLIANTFGISPQNINYETLRFLIESPNPSTSDATSFCKSLEDYIDTSSINRPLIAVSHGNILAAVHNQLFGTDFRIVPNCSYITIEYKK